MSTVGDNDEYFRICSVKEDSAVSLSEISAPTETDRGEVSYVCRMCDDVWDILLSRYPDVCLVTHMF